MPPARHPSPVPMAGRWPEPYATVVESIRCSCNSAQDLPEALAGVLKANDLLLTLGAGDIGAVAAELPQDFGAAERAEHE